MSSFLGWRWLGLQPASQGSRRLNSTRLKAILLAITKRTLIILFNCSHPAEKKKKKRCYQFNLIIWAPEILTWPYKLLTTNLVWCPAPCFMFRNNKILVNKTFILIIVLFQLLIKLLQILISSISNYCPIATPTIQWEDSPKVAALSSTNSCALSFLLIKIICFKQTNKNFP